MFRWVAAGLTILTLSNVGFAEVEQHAIDQLNALEKRFPRPDFGAEQRAFRALSRPVDDREYRAPIPFVNYKNGFKPADPSVPGLRIDYIPANDLEAEISKETSGFYAVNSRGEGQRINFLKSGPHAGEPCLDANSVNQTVCALPLDRATLANFRKVASQSAVANLTAWVKKWETVAKNFQAASRPKDMARVQPTLRNLYAQAKGVQDFLGRDASPQTLPAPTKKSPGSPNPGSLHQAYNSGSKYVRKQFDLNGKETTSDAPVRNPVYSARVLADNSGAPFVVDRLGRGQKVHFVKSEDGKYQLCRDSANCRLTAVNSADESAAIALVEQRRGANLPLPQDIAQYLRDRATTSVAAK